MTNPSLRQTADLTPSFIRTLTPMIAGPILTYIATKLGLPIEDVAKTDTTAYVFLTGLISAGFGYLYYVIARFAEVFVSDKWGYILGFKKKPVYVDPPAVVTDDSGTHVIEETEKLGDPEEPVAVVAPAKKTAPAKKAAPRRRAPRKAP